MNVESLQGIIMPEYNKEGQFVACQFQKENVIRYGENEFIPKYSSPDTRTKTRYAMDLYQSGNLKSIYLEKSTRVDTSIGQLQAELVTFYETGELLRLFPVYGQISGYWSEKEEKELLPEIHISMNGHDYGGKFSCICFYPSGAVKSLTIWPDEIIKIETNYGNVKVRYGICFYESGAIRSLEPAIPIVIPHTNGSFIAFNQEAVGVSGDFNSLCFLENGEVQSLYSSLTGLEVKDRKTNEVTRQVPKIVQSPMDITKKTVLPVKYKLGEESIQLSDSKGSCLTYNNLEFEWTAIQTVDNLPYVACSECSECSECSGCRQCSEYR